MSTARRPWRSFLPDLLEPTVGLGVDPRHEEARDGDHAPRITSSFDEPLEAPDVRLDDLGIALQREDERDVDGPSGGNRVLDRPDTGSGRRNLHVDVRPIDELVELLRLLERRVSLVREIGIDLDGHEPVDAGRPLPDGPHEVARALDVLHREGEEHLLGVVRTVELRAQLLVVPLTGRQGLLEDGRIGRDADDRVLLA